jgi:hypothetical protein
MAVPGQETMTCEEGEGMGNEARSFAIGSGGGGGGDGLIQAAQGQQWSIAAQGRGVQRAEPIEQR